MLTIQDLEIIKAFMKRATMTGDEAYEYARICNKLQETINETKKVAEGGKQDGSSI